MLTESTGFKTNAFYRMFECSEAAGYVPDFSRQLSFEVNLAPVMDDTKRSRLE